MFKKWMKNVAFAVALSVTLATTSMPAAVFAEDATEQTTVVTDQNVTQTYGTENTELAAGKYTVPASLMNASNITKASMAASCIAGDATMVVGEDGSVKVTVPITCVTVMGVTAYATDWKVYSDGLASATTDAEYTTDADGNVNSITFTVPDKAADGAYVNMTAMAGRAMDAFLKLDYANAKEAVDTAQIATVIDSVAALNQKDYTADSWKVLQEKLEAAKAAMSEKKSQKEVDAAVTALNEAIKGLQKASASTETQPTTQTQPSTQTQPAATTQTQPTTTQAKSDTEQIAANKVYTVSGKKYKKVKGKDVALVGITSKKATTVTVPATVKIKGVTYRVTRVAEKAFRNNKKIRTVIIGANVKTIGYQAFQGCKNLKKITMKTRKLNKIGALAFKGINKKAVIKVPASKKKAYKKLVKGKGQPKTVKVK